MYLLYYFRVFERQIGSNKYSVFILFSLLISFLGQVLAVGLLKDVSLKLNSAPYGLIFSSFVPFDLDIPISTRIRVFSLQFSDKSFIYLAGLQLLLSSWRRCVIPGICGLLAGSLYRLNVLYIQKAQVLGCIPSFFIRLRWPSIGSMPPASTRNGAGNIPSFTSRAAQRWRHWSHLLRHWFLWDSTMIPPGKHCFMPEMMSIRQQISFSKHRPTSTPK